MWPLLFFSIFFSFAPFTMLQMCKFVLLLSNTMYQYCHLPKPVSLRLFFLFYVYHHRSIGANMYMYVWTLPLLLFPAQFLEFCLFLWPKIVTKTKTEYWLSSKRYSMLFFCLEFKLFAFSCMRPWHQQQNSSILQFEFE